MRKTKTTKTTKSTTLTLDRQTLVVLDAELRGVAGGTSLEPRPRTYGCDSLAFTARQ